MNMLSLQRTSNGQGVKWFSTTVNLIGGKISIYLRGGINDTLLNISLKALKMLRYQGYFHDLRYILWSVSTRLTTMGAGLMITINNIGSPSDEYIYTDIQSLSTNLRSQPFMKNILLIELSSQTW